jgi:MFS family permease
MGVGQSFISGTDSAMLYDSLQETPHKKKYLKYEGRITSLGGFAETLAALLGGLIATLLSLHAVFIFQVFIAALAIPAAIMLVEPSRTKLQHRSFSQILEISSYTLFTHKGLSRTTLLSSVIGVATLTMAWTMQTFFVHYSLTESQITPLWVGLNLTVATVSLFAARLESRFGMRNLLVSMIIIIPLGYIAMGSFSFGIAMSFIFLFYIVRGYATPVLKDLIQEYCSSDIRATVLSVRGMLIRIGFSIVGPVIGYMSGRFSFEFATIAAGSLFLITSIAGFAMYVRLQRKIE